MIACTGQKVWGYSLICLKRAAGWPAAGDIEMIEVFFCYSNARQKKVRADVGVELGSR